MTGINQVIRQAINPFDPATFKPGNFWHEKQNPDLDVTSIHQEAIAQTEALLDQIMADHRTRTLMLVGDSGSGKSHLLGRLKRILNERAFFVYIDPFPESDAIWRHVLRYTVDSLVQTPQGQNESQLLLWLKSLSAFSPKGFVNWVLSDRQKFIRTLKRSYSSGIYNATEFFGVLYDLIDPDRYGLACEWLRGDDMDEDDLETLGVTQSIDSEDAAQKILANIGRIAIETRPIVLCFDQLDNIARTPEGRIDLQAIFNVNSSIRNQGLKNFLVIISIITSTWKINADRIQAADQICIDATIPLRAINLHQAEAIWASRLVPLHQQATPKPDSPIFPLTRQVLEQKFPGGKAYPRNVLELGRRLLQGYKTGTSKAGSADIKPGEDAIASFKLVWLKEFNRIQDRVTRLRQFSSPELIQMLKEVFTAFQVGEIFPRFLPSPTYASHSFSYEPIKTGGRIGIAWNDDPNMTTFYHVMNACRRAIDVGLCRQLILIRSEGTGQPGRKGYELFKQIFTGNPHQRLDPDLDSVHQLATYHSLVNAAYSGELVVAGKAVNIDELNTLIRQSKILNECSLLQELGIISKRASRKRKRSSSKVGEVSEDMLLSVEDFLMDLINTHQLLGRPVLVDTVLGQFSQLTPGQVNRCIETLCRHRQIQILDPKAAFEEQLICRMPDT